LEEEEELRRKRKAEERDPRNSAEKSPEESPEENPREDREETAKPPPSEVEDRPPPEPSEDWLPLLPKHLREAVQNNDWGKIPPLWRKLVEAYLKRLAEAESAHR
jgi:hypothetical protein